VPSQIYEKSSGAQGKIVLGPRAVVVDSRGQIISFIRASYPKNIFDLSKIMILQTSISSKRSTMHTIKRLIPILLLNGVISFEIQTYVSAPL
jgi:hypothetical protein